MSLLGRKVVTASAVMPKKEFRYFIEPFSNSSLCDNILELDLALREDTAQIILRPKPGCEFLLMYALEAGPLEEWGHLFTINQQKLVS